MNDARQSWHRLEGLFEVIELPAAESPVRLAIAVPSEALLRLPGFPIAALPESGRVASGRGLTSEICRASALGEAAELVSCCAWVDEKMITATEDELGPLALLPEALNGFSKTQLRERAQWNRRYGDFDWRPAVRNRRKPIDWIAVENAHGGPAAYAPADFAFIGRRQSEDAVALGDSNGCAAGATREQARLAAVLELIERDATGLWWYGGGPCALVDLASIDHDSEFLRWLAARHRRTWLFDITTNLGIPVLAASSAEADGSDVVLGFAARLDAPSAAIAALTEMLQMEFSLTTARAIETGAQDWADWRDSVTMTMAPLDNALCLIPQPLVAYEVEGIHATLDALARQDVDVYLADMTRLTIGMPAFRAISSNLCHFKPRYARHRLLAVTSEIQLESKPHLIV